MPVKGTGMGTTKMLRGFALLLGLLVLLVCAPLSAYAAQPSGYQFAVDNIVYRVNTGNNVFVWGVEDKSALPSVLTVPSKVTDIADGAEYNVVGTGSTVFHDCSNLEDIRFEGLGGGKVKPQVFNGCTNLRVIHFLTVGGFDNPGNPLNMFDTDSVGELTIVFHEGAWSFDDWDPARLPNQTTAYFETKFIQGDTVTTAYVRGQRKEGLLQSEIEIYDGTLVKDLASPSKVEVYSDLSEGADSICPVTSIPNIGSGDGKVWSYVPYGSDGEAGPAPSSHAISSCGTAKEVDATDLSYASVVVEEDEITYIGSPIEPSVSVSIANGDTVDSRYYTLSYYSSDGLELTADQIIGIGTYTVRVTGSNGYSGQCEAEFSIVKPEVKWYRASGDDRYATAQAASSQMVTFTGLDDENASVSRTRVLVNSDDWASCVVADSIAGVFNCPIVTCTANSLPERSKSPGLSGAQKGDVLIVGPESSVGAEVVKEASDIVVGSVSRISGKSSDAATMAVAVYDNVKKVESGELSLSLGDSCSGYGTSCLLVSAASEDAAVFSALSWAYASKAPVFFMSASGALDSKTVDRISTGGFTTVVAVGATNAMVSAISAQLPKTNSLEVISWQGSADVCAASASYAAGAVQTGEVSYRVIGLADVLDWGILSSAAAACGHSKGSLLLEDCSSKQSWSASLARIKSIAADVILGCVFGGYNSVPASCYEDVTTLWGEADYANLCTATLTLNATSVEENAAGVSPQFKLVDMNGNELVQGSDFTVQYFDNVTSKELDSAPKTPGSYTLTCKGTRKMSSSGYNSGEVLSGTYYNTRSASFTVTSASSSESTEQGSGSSGTDSASTTSVAVPGKVTGVKVSVGKRKATVSWKSVKRASSYQIAWRVKGLSKWKKSTVKSTKNTLKKLKGGKRYQFRVRAKGKAGWGAWSKVITSKKIRKK